MRPASQKMTPLKLVTSSSTPAAMDPEPLCRMHHFHLYRTEDPTGVSGTGCVAEGVVIKQQAGLRHQLCRPNTCSKIGRQFRPIAA